MSSPRIIIVSEMDLGKVTRLARNDDGYFVESWSLAHDGVAARVPISDQLLKKILSSADLKKMLGA